MCLGPYFAILKEVLSIILRLVLYRSVKFWYQCDSLHIILPPILSKPLSADTGPMPVVFCFVTAACIAVLNNQELDNNPFLCGGIK